MGQTELDRAIKKLGLEHLRDKPEELKAEMGRLARKWIRENYYPNHPKMPQDPDQNPDTL
jgi:hypothetical protein